MKAPGQVDLVDIRGVDLVQRWLAGVAQSASIGVPFTVGGDLLREGWDGNYGNRREQGSSRKKLGSEARHGTSPD